MQLESRRPGGSCPILAALFGPLLVVQLAVIGPSSEEPETTPFVKEEQSRVALPLLVHSGR
jgi:hypothetical protein